MKKNVIVSLADSNYFELLDELIDSIIRFEKSKEVARRLIEIVRDCEQHLKPGERLPMSTEILESLFGLYKQLERQLELRCTCGQVAEDSD